MREQLEAVEERGYDSGRKLMCRQVLSLEDILHQSPRWELCKITFLLKGIIMAFLNSYSKAHRTELQFSVLEVCVFFLPLPKYHIAAIKT